jgi:hypothetical protein
MGGERKKKIGVRGRSVFVAFRRRPPRSERPYDRPSLKLSFDFDRYIKMLPLKAAWSIPTDAGHVGRADLRSKHYGNKFQTVLISEADSR